MLQEDVLEIFAHSVWAARLRRTFGFTGDVLSRESITALEHVLPQRSAVPSLEELTGR